MFRQLFMVFHGECSASAHAKAHLHESPAIMTVPLVILGCGLDLRRLVGRAGIFLGQHVGSLAGAGLRRQEAHHGSVAVEIYVTLATLALVGAAIYLAYARYGRPGVVIDQDAEATGGGFYRLSLNKYYIDELYDRRHRASIYRALRLAGAGV